MAEGRLAKPNLRNLHLRNTRKSLVLAVSVSVACGLAYKLIEVDGYERKAVNFYKNYDPQKSLDRMNKAGLMQSAR